MIYCIPFYKGYLVINEKNDVVYSLDYNSHCTYKIVDASFSYIADLIYRYRDGDKISFNNIKVSYPYGSPIYKAIWNITRLIPYGEVRSYKWVSMKLGKKNYPRVVGNALAKNPVMIIVPCHRVIKSDGSLGGFSSGIDLKKYLLRLEGIDIVNNKILKSRY